MEESIEQELEQVAAIYQMIAEFFVNYSFQILGAIIILLIGLVIAKKVSNTVLALCLKKELDITLSHFLASATRVVILTMIAVITLSKIGISIGPFIAAIGAISLGAGLAVQGLLTNYSAGLSIIVSRPFVVGDTITVQGVTGLVTEVRLSYTLLTNEDDVSILIPNRHIVGEIIHNSAASSLAELQIGIAYDEDPIAAAQLIETALNAANLANGGKKVQVGVESFGDSSVNLCARIWLPTDEYCQRTFTANQLIFTTLQQHNISIPFPQREVRILDNP